MRIFYVITNKISKTGNSRQLAQIPPENINRRALKEYSSCIGLSSS